MTDPMNLQGAAMRAKRQGERLSVAVERLDKEMARLNMLVDSLRVGTLRLNQRLTAFSSR